MVLGRMVWGEAFCVGEGGRKSDWNLETDF